MYGGDDGELTGENIIYYLTVYNEPYVQPAEPDDLDVDGLLRGIYRYLAHAAATTARRCACSPPASRCRGRAGPATCSPRNGASAPRSGR